MKANQIVTFTDPEHLCSLIFLLTKPSNVCILRL